ncbi:hypothetical protein FRC00_011060, partial [Tulasnella sp. 408]
MLRYTRAIYPYSTNRHSPLQSWGNLRPGPFTAEDPEFRGASPIDAHQHIESNAVSINSAPPNDATITTRIAHPESVVSFNQSSTPLAPAFTTLGSPPFRSQKSALDRQGETEVLADMTRIVAPNVHQAKAQELRSQQATNFVISRVPPVTQRYNTTVPAHQSAEEQRMAATKVRAKADKQRIEVETSGGSSAENCVTRSAILGRRRRITVTQTGHTTMSNRLQTEPMHSNVADPTSGGNNRENITHRSILESRPPPSKTSPSSPETPQTELPT